MGNVIPKEEIKTPDDKSFELISDWVEVASPKQKDAVMEEAGDSSLAKPMPGGSSTRKLNEIKPEENPFSEQDIVAVLFPNGPVTTLDVIDRFKSQLNTQEDKDAFSNMLSRISKIKTTSGSSYVVLIDNKLWTHLSKQEWARSTFPVTEQEIRAFLLQNGRTTMQDVVARFKSQLKTPQDKIDFANILRRNSLIQQTSGSKYIVLRETTRN
ncbi:transcription activators DNA binding RNA polymerase II transcription factors catalytics transcription initiation factors [Euphorbia peplus]|nr:transcription activators DNA binding RNA polymerase II transcription factors catalytics transcription initiation factors [Euphorbia peplus]